MRALLARALTALVAPLVAALGALLVAAGLPAAWVPPAALGLLLAAELGFRAGGGERLGAEPRVLAAVAAGGVAASGVAAGAGALAVRPGAWAGTLGLLAAVALLAWLRRAARAHDRSRSPAARR